MPLKKGHSREVVSQNIHEMVRAGYEPKEAAAAALSSARKYKKMAMGGMVDADDDEGLGTNNDEEANRGLYEINVQGNYNPAGVENPAAERHDDTLAKALYMKAQDEGMMQYAMGGLVQGNTADDEPVGAKPSEDMESMSEEPMAVESEVKSGMGLSADAMQAISDRKKRRRMGQPYQG